MGLDPQTVPMYLIFIILLIREMITFAKAIRNNGKTKPADSSALLRKIDTGVRELIEMHDVRDEDGVPVWYVRKSLEDAVQNTSQCVSAIMSNLEKLTDSYDRNTKVIELLVRKLENPK